MGSGGVAFGRTGPGAQMPCNDDRDSSEFRSDQSNQGTWRRTGNDSVNSPRDNYRSSDYGQRNGQNARLSGRGQGDTDSRGSWRDYNGIADNPGNEGDRGGDPSDNRNMR